MPRREPQRYYPIALDVSGKKCVVAGGGTVALRKVRGLLECGAKVTVVAPELCASLAAMARKGCVLYRKKSYSEADLKGAVLVIGATDDLRVNEAVSAQARRRGILVNIVDDPDLCSFHIPSTLRRGPVVVAVSTGGASPALAARLSRLIGGTIGPEYGRLAELLGRMRVFARGKIASQVARKAAFNDIINPEILGLLAAGRTREAEKRARECILLWSGQTTRPRR
jgi:precorrin-2 dehydrogenase/sirohydrochlorin ferrochelatase